MKRLAILVLAVSLLPLQESAAGPFGVFGNKKSYTTASKASQQCVNGQCTPGLSVNANGGFTGQLPASYYEQAVSPITAVVLPQPELSIVIEQRAVESVTSIEQAEAAIEGMRATLADAEESLARLRLEEKRNAAVDEIKKRAANEVKWLEIEHTIDDLKAEQPKIGGDPAAGNQ